ncbi:MAG: hypothetical protein MZV70_15510 [Desulfobacterales bacterium]|nr:hypothetical protein [Desulfobacterales bacterium]
MRQRRHLPLAPGWLMPGSRTANSRCANTNVAHCTGLVDAWIPHANPRCANACSPTNYTGLIDTRIPGI